MNKINDLQFSNFKKGSNWVEKGGKQKFILTDKGRVFFEGFEIWYLGDLVTITKQSETVEPLRGSDLDFAFHLRLHRWLLTLKSFGLSRFINPGKGLI